MGVVHQITHTVLVILFSLFPSSTIKTKKKVRSHLHATLSSFDCPHSLLATSRYLIQIPLHTTPLIYQQSMDTRCQINSQCMATNCPQQKLANLIIILNDRLKNSLHYTVHDILQVTNSTPLTASITLCSSHAPILKSLTYRGSSHSKLQISYPIFFPETVPKNLSKRLKILILLP